MDDYSVSVELRQVQEDWEDTMGAVKSGVNKAAKGE